MSVLIRGVRPYGEGERVDVLVDDGQIAQIGPDLAIPDTADVIDATGHVLLPGFVDLHTHLREPGREYAEDIETGSAAAALGGYTAVFAMANTNPVADSPVVTDHVWHRGQQVGGGRRHYDQIGLLAEVNMRDRRNVGENVGAHRLTGERLEGRGTDEAQGGFGGNDSDAMTGLGELTNNRARLVGGDAPGDTDYYLLGDPFMVHHLRPALLLALGVLEQIGVDLAQRDGQRLLLQPRLNQRTDIFEDALAKLVVVVVDLPGTLCRIDHEGVFARDAVQQLVDGRIGDAQRGVVAT